MTSDRLSLSGTPVHLHEVFDKALDAVVGMDGAGKVIAWNPSAEALFGWPAAEAMGRRMSEMIVPHQHRAAHDAGLQHYHATGEGPVLNSRIRITALNRGGAEFPVELSILPIQSDGQEVFYAFIRSLVDEEKLNRDREMREQEARIIAAVSAAHLEDISTEEFVHRCLHEICEVGGWKIGHFYRFDVPEKPTVLRPSGVWHVTDPIYEKAAEITNRYEFGYGEGLPGRVWESGGPVVFDDIAEHPEFSRQKPFLDLGLTRGMAFPMRSSHGMSGVMEFFGTSVSRHDPYAMSFAEIIGSHVNLAFQRRSEAEHREILRRELSHRVGNSLAVLQSLFRRCAAEAQSVDDLRARFQPRLHAVGLAHRMVALDDGAASDLHGVVEGAAQLLPETGRIRIDGPSVVLEKYAVLPLTLALHELVTNTLKYGRWHETGTLHITWVCEDHDWVRLTWTESPAEQVDTGAREGYGSLLMRSMIESTLGGRLTRRFEDGAFRVEIAFPHQI